MMPDERLIEACRQSGCQLTPLGQRGGAVLLEGVAAAEVAMGHKATEKVLNVALSRASIQGEVRDPYETCVATSMKNGWGQQQASYYCTNERPCVKK